MCRIPLPLFQVDVSGGWERLEHRGCQGPGSLGDLTTTDHISPAGSLTADSPTGVYLSERRSSPATSARTAPSAEIMMS